MNTMDKMPSAIRRVTAVVAMFAMFAGVPAESQTVCPDANWLGSAEWVEPFPAYRVIGNLYAVGTAGLSVYLLTTDDGHVLINTGLEDSTGLIKKNVESLGFRLEDVKILLTMQAHFDHTAAMAEIQRMTGAKVWATVGDAPLLEDGGASDPHFGPCVRFRFPPVKVERILSEGDVVELGSLRLSVHEHPGHTPGSSSYSLTVSENGQEYSVLIVNMATINAGKRLVVDPTYPGVAEDFAATFRKQKQLDVDIWVAAHGTQFNLTDKYVPGQAYDPDTFVDPEGYKLSIEKQEGIFLKQLGEERNGIE